MKPRIFVLEDDKQIALGLRLNLEAAGFEIIQRESGEEALEVIKNNQFEIILLDIMLPGINGFKVCEKIRSSGNFTPVLFLTAKSDTSDRVLGLKLGADDYITKPFSPQELVERIKAILRRQKWFEDSALEVNSIEFGGNSVNFSAYTARTKNGEISLTQKECMLLKLLVENEGKVIDRNTILDSIWGYDQYPSSRTIDNLILNLRKYFEEDPKSPVYILTQYGAGYLFNSSGK